MTASAMMLSDAVAALVPVVFALDFVLKAPWLHVKRCDTFLAGIKLPFGVLTLIFLSIKTNYVLFLSNNVFRQNIFYVRKSFIIDKN